MLPRCSVYDVCLVSLQKTIIMLLPNSNFSSPPLKDGGIQQSAVYQVWEKKLQACFLLLTSTSLEALGGTVEN